MGRLDRTLGRRGDAGDLEHGLAVEGEHLVAGRQIHQDRPILQGLHVRRAGYFGDFPGNLLPARDVVPGDDAFLGDVEVLLLSGFRTIPVITRQAARGRKRRGQGRAEHPCETRIHRFHFKLRLVFSKVYWVHPQPPPGVPPGISAADAVCCTLFS
jgi:hypothetical protein